MKRFGRWMFKAFAMASLALSLATSAMWVRSYQYADEVRRVPPKTGFSYSLYSGRGAVLYTTFFNCDCGDCAGYSNWYGILDVELGGALDHPISPYCRFVPRAGFGFRVAASRFDPYRLLIQVPYWFLVLVFVAPMLSYPLGRRWGRRGKVAAAARCPACAYDLRATPARCPECGTITSNPQPATP